ncbi:AT-rich interactive domain-containing protein 2 isoform X2 [Stomoxys calcitrans]|uniref:AT-rich interactive domain-containing protein 2 isoform X2 n=1 Tax=Stomoxys calcitrans TaxID=35570 RepID=UPI0027E34319|nr:AT-rich interactive domain-containing protein 2 isoform X2 [Stomoxys calcitrans]
MLLTEPVKTNNMHKVQQTDISLITSAPSNSAVPVQAPTTPLRSSRNQNRGDKNSDDRFERENNATATKGRNPPKPPDEFYKDLQQFHEKRGTTIRNIPRISGREVDLHRLYCVVTNRGGFLKVNARDEWDDVLPELGWKEKIVNGSAGLKFIYRRFLEKYERVSFFGEDPEKIDAQEAAELAEMMGAGGSGRGGRGNSRYPSTLFGGGASTMNNIAMTYNYKQHHVNMDRRRQFKLSTDLHKSSPYEKLMLSLLSPLPNEQDFAINACTLMANESKHTLKVNEYPKLLDALLAHTGVYSDYSMRKLFQHIYNGVRHHSLYGFWYDLLHGHPQILELYTDEQTLMDSGVIDDWDDGKQGIEEGIWYDSKEYDFLNLGRGLGTHDYVGQRVLQIVAILRNLSFIAENLPVLVKNKTLLRFLVMGSNIRWSNVHIQALEITGNIAAEIEMLDPTTDELSRCLMATICDGIDGPDRGVIINCLEILYKLCQREANEEYILKCLNEKFYNTIALFLSLNDIMLLLFTLEAIYALTCMGSKSCQSMMHVRGIVDQLISLITVEAQSYGPDGCILMRVVETVPGNMLPMVAQNIANLQNAAVMHKSTPHASIIHKQQIIPNPNIMSDVVDSILPFHGASSVVTPVEHHHHNQQQHHSQSQQPQQPQPQNNPPPPPQMQMPPNFTQDDDQFALAWLGATFERANTECHIEQQELYRMYLSHCQKAGKQSVLNHMQFPKLMRLIFSSAVGPAIVRRSDGTELPGTYYISLRMRAQPLPMQQKSTLVTPGPSSPGGKQNDNNSPTRKIKKKLKDGNTLAATNVSSEGGASQPVVENAPKAIVAAVSPKPQIGVIETTNNQESSAMLPQPNVEIKCDEKMDIEEPAEAAKVEEHGSVQPVQPSQASDSLAASTEQSPQLNQAHPQHASQTSLIKSLLANKVNQRQQKQKDQTTANASTSTPSTSNIPCGSGLSTVASSPQPIKVASTAITALVSNPLMQNTPVKVGQTTIKPLNPTLSMEKKQTHISESTPPPLAPLSGANVAKDSSGRPILLANQMLVDILDKKMIEPPIPATIIQKRKVEDTSAQNKRMALDSSSINAKDSEVPVTPSKNAANLYAEMAASILEDEDLEELSAQQNNLMTEQPMQQHPPSLIIPAAKVQTAVQNVPRQLVFQHNQPSQLKVTQANSSAGQTTHPMPNAVATIKTDQGLQTVPVILHQKPLEATQHGQPQQIIQQVIQQQPAASQTQTTQYVLATNQQGQTYLVAQQTPQSQPVVQPPPPTQTVLVTQTPQQQSTGGKTIIILQQNSLPGPSGAPQQIITTTAPGQQQKMIMTTPQGQQVLLTQRPQTPQQIFINPQTGAATHIQHVPAQSRQIIQTTTTQTMPSVQQNSQLQTGQMSPSLLNQLNQIPATIKLHQPVAQVNTAIQPSQQNTVSRMSIGTKGVAIVQGHAANPPATPVAIPQLQQHQSIIQQHIISGPAEKRHVILGGGRAIEIKETLITQAQPPPQQCQLNSQTIITTQQPTQSTVATNIIQQHQQQQQQQQTQQQHLPQQQPQPQTQAAAVLTPKVSTVAATMTSPQTPALIAAVKTSETHTPTATPPPPPPSLIQTSNQSNLKKSLTPSLPPTLIKPSLPTVKLPPGVGSGPPPLAAVNSNATTPTLIAKTAPHSAIEDKKEDSLVKVAPPPATSAPLHVPVVASNTLTATTQAACGNQTSNAASNTTVSGNPQAATAPSAPQAPGTQSQPQIQTSTPQSLLPQLTPADAQWLFICDWRNCPRKKFKSLSDLQHHVCTSHAPDHLDPSAEIFCQWGVGPGLCDGIPRKRFSLMTHLIDRHLTVECLRSAMQRRIATGAHNIAPAKPPVTIVRNIELSQRTNTASPSLSTSSSSSSQATPTGSSALQAIKRHTADFLNCKELMDENEGPVTKSIRLTAALILRNLVIYTTTAKRSIRRYEPHLANIALSNVESSGTISNILYELNN